MNYIQNSKIYRYKRFVKLIIITFFLTSTLSLKAQWVKKDEVAIIVKLYNQGKTLGLTESESVDFATCAIEKIKIAIPNPTASKLTSDEWYVIGRKTGLECASNYQFKIRWNQETEEMLKTYLNNVKEFKILTKESKDNFSDCVISKLKLKYPNGFSKIPEEDAAKIGEECILLIMKQ